MRDRLTDIRKALDGAIDTARANLPEISLASDVEVPVYVLHHGPDAEDYELICDFQKFMAESQSGLLHRPVLKLWAGRQDFERYLFARRLREAFARQFDEVREARREEQEAAKKRWFFEMPSIGDIVLWSLTLTGGLVGTLLLYIATSTGRSAIQRIGDILGSTGIGKLFGRGSAEAELEDLIAEKKTVIDDALSRIEISLHRDLYTYAWHGQRPGPMTGMDRDAWPLPTFVRERMES